MPATQVRTMPPLKLTGFMYSTWAAQVLKTALELDIFSALKGKGMTSSELSDKLQLDKRATPRLLNALVSMELLKKSADRYELTDLADAYLVKDSHLYFGKFILGKDMIDEQWRKLADTMRTGKPQQRVNQMADGETFFKELTAAIFPMNYTTAQSLTDELKVAALPGQVRVLDLAAGSAVWSLPMAQANKNVNVDALDFPGVLDVTKQYANKFGVAERYQYLAGNWRDVKLQPESYDFILLGHILHSEGKEASIELLKYCSAALKKGGTLVIAEFLENEDRLGPIFATLFAINMLIATENGCTFTVEELKDMLKQAGLHDAKRLSLPFWDEQSPVMVAKK